MNAAARCVALVAALLAVVLAVQGIVYWLETNEVTP